MKSPVPVEMLWSVREGLASPADLAILRHHGLVAKLAEGYYLTPRGILLEKRLQAEQESLKG